MPFEKGHKLSGSRKGKPNKTTQEFRDGLNKFFDGQWEKMKKAFEDVRKDNPAQYLTLMEKYMGYSFPKRKDITSDDKPIQPAINISEHRTEPEAD